MKVLLFQPAAPTYEPQDHRSNVPLAAGNLAAFARGRLAARGVSIEVLDRDLADRAGDAALARILRERGADVFGATLYCWSSHRTLAALASAREGRRVPALVGGPEVAPGNAFLESWAGRAFDLAVPGEGEEVFADVLEAIATGANPANVAGVGAARDGRISWTAPRAPVADLSGLPSPYVGGEVRLRPGGIAHLETARGCVFECDFCFYHADFRKVRTFPEARVAAEVRAALGAGVRDLYLMDPTFNGHSGYRRTLRALRAELGGLGAGVHTEIRAEPIDADAARELAEAGITTVEVGLQSITPEALAAVGRTFDRERFARGCRALEKAGIRVEIGTIVGLPGDTRRGMEATFRYARDECGSSAETIPFVLSLLPATVLRERASGMAIEHRFHPPYQVVRTPTFDGDAIRATLAAWEEMFDSELDPISTVRLVERGGAEDDRLAPSDLVRRVFVRLSRATADELAAAGRRLADRVASTLAVVFRDLEPRKAIALLRPLREANPHGLLEIVLDLDEPRDAAAIARDLRRALPPIEGHYLNEHLRYSAPEVADLSLRIAAVLPLASAATWGRSIAEQLPVAWRVGRLEPGALEELRSGPFASGALLVEETSPAEVDHLAAMAGDDGDDLRFAESAAQRRLDALVGRPDVPEETAVVLGDGGRIAAVRRGL
ncbi:MAG TPA: B12-binding domain-containing radical SAM protein [Planctomycetota bacterium]|nr:B12-binding domain-containing radical SAM protein [Planctomycetota bacterium]